MSRLRYSRRNIVAAAAIPLVKAFAIDGRKKVAALISEYRPNSHADVIMNRVLNGCLWNGQVTPPRLRCVSMYTDQVPDEDLSRDAAAKYGFKLTPSIRHALTMTSDTSVGERRLAVDGVLLICEHGAYPYNPLGQKLYPRYEFFKQVVDVFRETGETVPVFCDKHLSYDWDKAKWMYHQARELQFPLLAGSVLPVARDPRECLPACSRVDRAVLTWSADFFDSKESYGFHALERLQSLVERRAGGETGITAVQCFERDAAWEWIAANAWVSNLLDTIAARTGWPRAVRDTAKEPIAFSLKYRSGLCAAVLRLNGWSRQGYFGAFREGSSDPVVLNDEKSAPELAVPAEFASRYSANHFSALVRRVEDMIYTRSTPQPVERTLLTTGALAALHQSSYRPSPMYGRSMQHGTHLENGMRIETPQLVISYAGENARC